MVIDTTDATIAYVERVFAKYPGTFGVGHEIKICVEFSQEVTITASEAHLVLNVENGTNYRHAELITYNNRSEIQEFLYIVKHGESVDPLDYFGVDSLVHSNDGNITNNLNMLANITLPDPGTVYSLSQSNVSIISNRPNVTEIYTTKPSGEYGVGEEILFVVNYSFPVTVVGYPFLPLNL
eukprot:CAMPEP_0117890514 /NCGR_PEP_ID=MMETSP0950-20121206/23336_1 /TAXON_ID=44440 /ORGANISM="Chattonella subsalsa, Strain CCMP2191" /LENGTH=180 /DNA_ID=CAMNT_0005749717 /DNA_START=193 /DNA_END=731 /DNA_ORIENTATION=+